MANTSMIKKRDVGRPGHLPDFECPPVTEVVLSLQFAQLPKFGFAQIGQLWECFRGEFPQIAYHPPLASGFETFGLRQSEQQSISINLGMMPQLPRSWFVNETGTEIVQFQPDRFVHNWRKAGSGATYPRYEHIRARFEEEIGRVQNFFGAHDLGPLVPNQCEVAYVNEIAAPDGSGGDPTSLIFNGWKSTSYEHIGDVEDVAFTARYLIKNSTGEPVGRLVAQSTPGLSEDGQAVIQFTLVGRGPPAQPTIEASLNFMDLARDHIVCGFAEMTTEQMHRIWKRRN